MKKLYGTGVALITPFTPSGDIDFPSLKKMLAHTAKGVDYYVVMGTTGESAVLSKEEKKQVLSFVLKNNKAGLPIVYGIGGNNTAAVIEEINHTDLRSVDAVLSVSPYYNKPSQEGIVRHFTAVADACPVPVILYNVPGRTASNLSADTTLRLANHSNIIGIKEASGNLEQCMKIAQEKPRDFMLISGDDMLTFTLYAIGGVGVISVLANALPLTFKKIKEHFAAGDLAKARKEQFKLLDINGPMYEEGNPVGVKQLLSDMGVCGATVRLPLAEASPRLREKIKVAYAAIKKG
ncbi:MAG: 4-hydroxy-tetrahydrodipicolinate synthase [Cyclobacteriaceae bacterium]|nr:4-hydroxy-tetrahydrodipicolinate synthase [Cyclobacteriaceae bacterium]